ncbi:hypothetical protein EPUS_08128 [Endocarpon pusillum Z07020]|uniref:Transcription factor domain-containing protein n=1 Tax=Endocarpon pusillum (strain Z07020 / HMAS-L-300199) TaxID=1263415 RepID=U1HTY2_ENDPU|nr:uncharacterized protein EPUS_08128 [Endocarpon pusillum Z07020]ERF74080.1 hypothetical protein EPUS_08128 [Endocarpon pusillum Z07020]
MKEGIEEQRALYTRGQAARGRVPRSGGTKPEEAAHWHLDYELSYNAAILASLQKLEDFLLGLRRTPLPSSNSETSRSISVAPSCTSPHRLHGKESSRKDSEWLEDVGIRTNSLISGLSDRITFRVGTIQQILAITSSPPGSQTRSNCNATNCVWLPTQDEALRLLENYCNNIEHLQHILHAPSVRMLVNDVYAHIIENKPVQSGHVALLLSIFASTSYYWNIRDQISLLFPSSEESNQAALMWGKTAFDVLDNSRRTTSGAIEDVQATIVMYFLVLSLEGSSARCRSLMNTALVIARDFSLHRIDAPKTEELKMAEGEVGFQ